MQVERGAVACSRNGEGLLHDTDERLRDKGHSGLKSGLDSCKVNVLAVMRELSMIGHGVQHRAVSSLLYPFRPSQATVQHPPCQLTNDGRQALATVSLL